MNTRLTEQLAEWVRPAVDKYDQGEDVLWEILFIPSPQGIHVAFIFSIPSGLISQNVTSMSTAELPSVMGMDEDAVDDLVRQSLDKARDTRTEELAKGMNLPTA